MEKGKVVLTFDPASPIDPRRLVAAVGRGKGRREFTPDQRLKLSAAKKGWEGMLEETEEPVDGDHLKCYRIRLR